MKPGAALTEELVMAPAPRLFSTGQAFAWLLGYFLLQVLFRVLVSSAAELDESEQIMNTQAWHWGYGSDPPLYTWLQILSFQLLGTNVLALALLKNLVLFAAFAFTYLATREITGDSRVSRLAMLSLFLFPQITWESQRDLTHSVLATALAVATFYALVRVSRTKKPVDYLLLGVALGAGTLSKYSYALFALALLGAALGVPAFRSALANKWVLLTIVVCALLTVPYFQWISMSPDLAMRRTQEVMQESDGRMVMSRLLALVSVFKCLVMLAGLPALVYLLLFRGMRSNGCGPALSVERLIYGTLLGVAAMALIVSLGAGVELRDRWFQPIVFLGAIGAALPARGHLTALSEVRFARVIGGIAAVALIVLPAIPVSASVTRRPTRLNAPYPSLAAQLKKATGEPAVILASTRLVGGNLRLWFPHSAIMAPEMTARPSAPAGTVVAVWDASKALAAPRPLVGLVREWDGSDLEPQQPRYVDAPFQYTKAKKMKLGYVVLAGR